MLDAARAPIRKWHLRRTNDPVALAMRMLMFDDAVTRAEAENRAGRCAAYRIRSSKPASSPASMTEITDLAVQSQPGQQPLRDLRSPLAWRRRGNGRGPDHHFHVRCEQALAAAARRARRGMRRGHRRIEPRRPCRSRHWHRHQRARGGAVAHQREPQRHQERRVSQGRPVCASRRREVRPHHFTAAVRVIAARPRQRDLRVWRRCAATNCRCACCARFPAISRKTVAR